MSLSLHTAIIPSWLQITASTRALVDKAEAWCEANGEAPESLLDAQISDDMWGFTRQINSVWMHSAHALAAVEAGRFVPEFSDIPDSFDACRTKLDAARNSMLAVDESTLAAIVDNDLDFVLGGEVRMSFTVQNFLLSFSNPNFYFHAATAYDILRMKGVEMGKRDYLGALAIKG